MPNAALKPETHPIAELKVTAHLMTMEEGLFCIYNTPGSAPPDAATGLPGVRITPAPGGTGAGVTVSGFNAEGWLSGDAGAALVRIGGGPAQVLVTVYQDAEAGHDAPKLQVIRLSDAPVAAPVASLPASLATAAAAPAPIAAAAEAPVQAQPEAERPFEIAAHIYGRGDVGGHLGEWVGEPGGKRWIEGFGLAPTHGIALADIEYQAVLGRGWLSPWAEGGQFCGSRGMSLPILGLRVRLRGDAASAYTAQVSATFVDGTRVGPVGDGGAVEAPSLSPLEAFQVTVQPIGAAKAGQVASTARIPRATPGQAPGRKAAMPAARAAAPPAAAMPAAAPAPTIRAASAKPARGKAGASAPAGLAQPASGKVAIAKPASVKASVPMPAGLPKLAPANAVAAKPARGKAALPAPLTEPAPAPAGTPAGRAAKAAVKRTPATTRRR